MDYSILLLSFYLSITVHGAKWSNAKVWRFNNLVKNRVSFK